MTATGPTSRTLIAVDANGHSYAVAALSWALQHRPADMETNVGHIRPEQIQPAIDAVTELRDALLRRLDAAGAP